MTKNKRIILKVRETKEGQKLVTIPKESDIEKGDYIEVKRIK